MTMQVAIILLVGSIIPCLTTDYLADICISGSSNIPEINGRYYYHSWSSEYNGPIYYYTDETQFLYPWIYESQYKQYLISHDPSGTVAAAYCLLPSSMDILSPYNCTNYNEGQLITVNFATSQWESESSVQLFKCDSVTSSKYFIITESVSWSVAKALCEFQGTNLASLHSESDWEEAKKLCKGSIASGCWIGLNDIDNEGVWQWDD